MIFKPVGDPNVLKAIHAELGKAIASGAVTHIDVDGVPMIISEMTTPDGHTKMHPTDPSQDKHTPHPPGRSHSAGDYSYTLVAKS